MVQTVALLGSGECVALDQLASPIPSEQYAFTYVLLFLRRQGVASRSGMSCFYRAQCEVLRLDGVHAKPACAAGALIPDSLYQPDCEGSVSSLEWMGDYGLLRHFANVSTELLRRLQIAHDDHMPGPGVEDEVRRAQMLATWESEMRSIARLHGLEFTEREAPAVAA